MKPNGLVAAASMTSRMSIPMASQTIFSSLTRPMLTARWMFSRSLVISAARVEETGTTRSMTWPYRATPTSRHAGVTPPQTLGMVRVVKLAVARVFPLGGKDQEDVAPDLEPAGFETRQEFFVGGAGIGRALQRNDLAGAKIRHDEPRWNR